MFGVALKSTSWNEAIEENGDLDFCSYLYGPDEDLPAMEIAIEGQDCMDEDDFESYPYPQKSSDYNFRKWFSQYVQFVAADSVQEILSIPLKVTEEDGFFAFAVGYPYENCGLPSGEIFYAGYGNESIEHFTWDLEEPCDEMLQEGSFLFTVLSKLKAKGALRDDIDIYRFFEDFDVVERNRYDLERLCKM